MKVYLDTADIVEIERLCGDARIDGFTTNPLLMRTEGIDDYAVFAKHVLAAAAGRPVSFEVAADDVETMRRQATKIAAWGDNVFVKIPVVLTDGTNTERLVKQLAADGVRVNVTAVMSGRQIMPYVECFPPVPSPAIVSVFAGRLADIGIDPERVIENVWVALPAATKVLWASAREIFNVVQAERAGADIITLTPGLFAKLDMLKSGKTAEAYSVETVEQFWVAAQASGLTL